MSTRGRFGTFGLVGAPALLALWLLLAVVMAGAGGCSSDDDGASGEDGSTTATTAVTSEEPADTTGQATDDTADPGESTDEDMQDDASSSDTDATTGGSALTADQEDGAIDIARAYFVAQTDFTGDQFEWTLEAAALDDDGQWWARVSAAPLGDTTLETEQIYVYSPPDSGFWFAHDMGTGIDPATDESFPEEVRDELQIGL